MLRLMVFLKEGWVVSVIGVCQWMCFFPVHIALLEGWFCCKAVIIHLVYLLANCSSWVFYFHVCVL